LCGRQFNATSTCGLSAVLFMQMLLPPPTCWQPIAANLKPSPHHACLLPDHAVDGVPRRCI
jgi:hypothetical protein